MYFISDTHFFHTNIIKLTGRPFDDYNQMNYTMIKNWNKTVSPNDIVYHLGDFAYGLWKIEDAERKLTELFHSLNGVKHLIVGNHDPDMTLSLPWAEVSYYKELMYNKKRIVLSHYPILEWHDCFKGSLHLHGHTHQESPLEVMNRDVELMKTAQHHFPYNPNVVSSRFSNFHKNWRNICVEKINYTPQHIDDLIKE